MSSYSDAGLFLLLSFIWGTAFVAISAGLPFVPPVLFAGIRYDIAGILMLMYAATRTEGWFPRSAVDWLTVCVSGLLVIALYNGLLFIGQQTVSSGTAAILVATNPILATAFSRVFLTDERLRPRGLFGLILGFLGVGFVVLPDPTSLFAEDVVAAGFVVGAAVAVALGSVIVQRIDSDLTAESTVVWSCGIGAIVLHVTSIFLPGESVTDLSVTWEFVVAIGYLSVFASAIGYVIYFHLLDRVGAIQINLVSYAAPVFATVFGWLVLRETITLSTVVGFIVITVGFFLVKYDAVADLVGPRISRH